MKKQLLFLAMILLPMVASAEAVEINGIYYNLISKASVAEVTSNPNSYSGSVTIPEMVTYNGVNYNVTVIGGRAFANCMELSTFEIPSSVLTIGDYAFEYCLRLTTVNLPSSITSIGDNAFSFMYLETSKRP